MRRFVVRPEAIDAHRVRFDPEEAHHLGRVLRLGLGELVEVTDGTGRAFAVRIDALEPGGAWGTIVSGSLATRESPCAITLAQAVLKGERMGWVIQKATELGVSRIVPLVTERVVARVTEDRAAARRTRWQRIAREAVKQCGRAVTPVIEATLPFDHALAEVAGHDIAWLLWEGGGTPVAVAAREPRRPRRLLLLVGPEGGFTDAEVVMAESKGARLIGLGPRILRADSAGLVALALCQHLFGDLGS